MPWRARDLIISCGWAAFSGGPADRPGARFARSLRHGPVR